MKTTLNQIREQSPCAKGWAKLLKNLCKKQADDDPLLIITILDSNGFDDALWCLRAVYGYDREIRLYAVWCARQVQHLMTNSRSIAALDVAERFANGEATEQELEDARAVAWSVAGDAAGVAAWSATWSAAGSAAGAAAGDAGASARDATRAAAWSAAGAAAGDAAWSSAGSAAGDATRLAQETKLRELCAEIDVKEPK